MIKLNLKKVAACTAV